MPKTAKDFEDLRDSFLRRMQTPFRKYHRYCKWFKNDFSDIRAGLRLGTKEVKPDVSVINMVGLVARSQVAHLFYNAPQMVVKPEMIAKEGLAAALTKLGNGMIEDMGLYWEGRKMVLDSFLAPYMVAKQGYYMEVGEDEARMEEERKLAELENRKLSIGYRVNVKSSDIDPIHIERHNDLLDMMLSGALDVPEEVVDYVKEHIDKHKKQVGKKGKSQGETVRVERVFTRRKKPTAVFFDLWANDFFSLRFVGETYLLTAEEFKQRWPKAKADQLPGEKDSDKVLKIISAEAQQELNKDGVERMFVTEVIDLRNMTVISYVPGASGHLEKKDYDAADIMPAGPYTFGFATADPEEIVGVSQPSFWEDQQRDIAILHTVEMMASKASVPGYGYDASYVEDDEMLDASLPIIARRVKFKKLGEKSIRDVLLPLPTPQLTPETFKSRQTAMEIIERASMLGAVRTGGGDKTRTATASALVAEAVGAFTQDMSIMVDQFFKRIVKNSLRLGRKYYDVSTVMRYIGDQALDVWPERGFTTSEILDDRGVEIVVGTMRRESTAVELKLMGEVLQILGGSPMLGHPALQKVFMKLLDHLMKLYGAPINLSEEIKAVEEQPAPLAEGGGSPSGSPSSPQSLDDILQGISNVGGGRTPTGAGAEDKPRLMR